jgi:hypothetical protein
MDISNTSTTTLNGDFNQVKRLLNQQNETREQQFNTLIKGLGGIENTYDSATHNRTIQKKAYDCKRYCIHNKEIEAKLKSANEIKSTILDDLKNGIEILKENGNTCDFEPFYKSFQLLNSKDLDTSKLDITNQYDDKQCRYIDGTNKTSYTVIYNNTELFTITNTDSATRFLNTEELTSGLDFDLKIHPGFDSIYSSIDLTTVNSLLNAKERIETDIKSGIAIYEDQNKNDSSHSCSPEKKRNEKIKSLNKILNLLEDDSIDLTKLEIKDIFGNDFTSPKGYTVYYNGKKLFTINNTDQGMFEIKYTRVKDFEIDYYNDFYELYNSSSLIHADAMNLTNDIKEDLEIGIETIQEHIENNDTDKEYYNKKIEDINKMLKLLDSKDIDILKLRQTNLRGSYDVNDDEYGDYDDWSENNGYTVTHNSIPLFCITQSANLYGRDFKIELL